MFYLYGVIGISDKCNKEAEDHVYKQTNEGVQIEPTEQPHQHALLLDLSKRCKHIITIDQRKQTLSHCVQIFKLENNKYKLLIKYEDDSSRGKVNSIIKTKVIFKAFSS